MRKDVTSRRKTLKVSHGWEHCGGGRGLIEKGGEQKGGGVGGEHLGGGGSVVGGPTSGGGGGGGVHVGLPVEKTRRFGIGVRNGLKSNEEHGGREGQRWGGNFF